jgi:hypothetical protein
MGSTRESLPEGGNFKVVPTLLSLHCNASVSRRRWLLSNFWILG